MTFTKFMLDEGLGWLIAILLTIGAILYSLYIKDTIAITTYSIILILSVISTLGGYIHYSKELRRKQ